MVIRFRELGSTNSYLKENLDGLPQYAVVTADYQTAGRGQRGNGWEAEPGKNLLMSMLYYPPEGLHPSCQFMISKAVSLATVETVDKLLEGVGHPEVCVKWPNDIYVGDMKVAGILIEHSIQSACRIAHSVIGIGLNVNQRDFRSDAPNPVSIIDFTDREIPVETVSAILRESLIANLACLEASLPGKNDLDSRYRSRLWRHDGFHPYISLTASSMPAPTAVKASGTAPGNSFEAEIVDVAADGPLTLRLRSGQLRTFHFKELAPLLP